MFHFIKAWFIICAVTFALPLFAVGAIFAPTCALRWLAHHLDEFAKIARSWAQPEEAP